ncbi:MAG: hypothetical protein RMJ17_01325 [Candidatus Aenigmarchaeota archaeon]|nr:hypothetical protein [Candidatus Aenigmarchaeota archaeon]MDW8149223.1 hypothetical protein [Candidatus Aenigmarchaeota archaeon]
MAENKLVIKNFLIFTIISIYFLALVFARNELTIPIQIKEISHTKEVIKIDIKKSKEIEHFIPGCKNLCGDGICQEIVCLAIGCPCPETSETCKEDCKELKELKPVITLQTDACIKISPLEEKPIIIDEKPVEFSGMEEVPILVEAKFTIPSKFNITEEKTSIRISLDKNKKIANLEINNVLITTKENLKIENSSLKIETKKRDVVVNITPELAKYIINNKEKLQEIKKIELKKFDDKVVYEINGLKKVKLFWLIPILINIKSNINVENGGIEKIEKSWWSFFIKSS